MTQQIHPPTLLHIQYIMELDKQQQSKHSSQQNNDQSISIRGLSNASQKFLLELQGLVPGKVILILSFVYLDNKKSPESGMSMLYLATNNLYTKHKQLNQMGFLNPLVIYFIKVKSLAAAESLTVHLKV